MKIFTTIFDYIRRITHRSDNVVSALATDTDPIDLYSSLATLYNNDDQITTGDTTRRLRTVVNRSVEFYVSKMLPGDKIQVVNPENPAVAEAMQRILKMSNFQAKKPAMLRGYALYGDSFIRVKADESTVAIEDVSPLYVTEFSENSIGLLTTLRIDVPTLNENGQPVTYTEYWTLDGLSTWTHMQSRTTPISNLGTPNEFVPLSEMGITFIPVVHTKFKDTGDVRGQSCVYHALDKIYEANRLATRLHDLQFRHNKPTWAIEANMRDKDGRAMPAPRVGTGNASSSEENKEFIFGDIAYLPGTSTLQALVPNINFESALAVLNAQMTELEEDLPELRWYSIQDSQLSGAAIQKLLAGAVDRALEGRNNFIASLKRVDEMALQIGIFMGLFPDSLGSFGDEAWNHDILVDDMFGQTIDERAATLKTLTDSGIPLPVAMKMTGFSEQEIQATIELTAAQDAQRNADLASSLLSFNRG